MYKRQALKALSNGADAVEFDIQNIDKIDYLNILLQDIDIAKYSLHLDVYKRQPVFINEKIRSRCSRLSRSKNTQCPTTMPRLSKQLSLIHILGKYNYDNEKIRNQFLFLLKFLDLFAFFR